MKKPKKLEIANSRLLYCAAFLLCSIALFFFLKVRDSGKDKTAPRIYIAGEELVYTEGDNEDVLLEGIRAEDDVDGDVTDSVRVRSIYYADDTGEAIVTYVSKDKSNNIATARRKVSVSRTTGEPEKNPIEADSEADSGVSDEGEETAGQ